MNQNSIRNIGGARINVTGVDGAGKSIISAIILHALDEAGFVVKYDNPDNTVLPTQEELETLLAKLRDERNVLLDRTIMLTERDEGLLKASSR